MFVICYILCFCNIFSYVLTGQYIIKPSLQNAVEGFDFTLNCVVPEDMTPPRRLAWTRNTLDVAYMSPWGEEPEIIDGKYTFLIKHERMYELIIKGADVIAENGSRWRCQDAAGGSHSYIYEIMVLAFGLPVMSGYRYGDILREGDSITLTCDVTGSNMSTGSVVWRCGDTDYPEENEVTYTKIHSSITMLIDRGLDNSVCTCDAYLNPKLNMRRSTSIRFLMHYSPNVTVTKEITAENSTLILTCVANGNPDTYSFYGWKHMRNQSLVRSNEDFDWMSVDKSELVLKNISYQDNGEYVCSVDNGYRDINGTLVVGEGRINIYVEEPPGMKIVTRFRKDENAIDLFCVPTTSRDLYTVTGWTQATNDTTGRSTKDFTSLTDNKRVLTLNNYTYTDSGVYTCFYNYRHIYYGQTQTSLEFEGKIVFVVENNNFSFRAGDNGLITISFYSNPGVNSVNDITWENTDAGYRLVPSRRFKFSLTPFEVPIGIYGIHVFSRGQVAELEIKALTVCDAGEYSLTIENGQGLTSSMDIYIHVIPANDAGVKELTPEGPINLRTKNITENSVDLSWDSQSEEPELQTLVLSYRDISGPEQTIEMRGTSDSITVTNLTSTMMYRFSLYAYSDQGNSSMCGPIEIVTKQRFKDSTVMSIPMIGLLSTLVVIVFVIILIPAVFCIHKKYTDTKYVRLRPKRKRTDGVYYDRMNQRIGLINPLAGIVDDLIDTDQRRCSMVEYSEIKDFMLSSLRSRQTNRPYLCRRSCLSSYYSESNLYFPASLLADMQNYENTRLNS